MSKVQNGTVTGTSRELWLFIWYGILTLSWMITGVVATVRSGNWFWTLYDSAPIIFFYCVFPTYRWFMHTLLCGMASGGTYLGQSLIGCLMDFETPDRKAAKGTIVRCSPALTWRVVRTLDNKYFLLDMPLEQPFGRQRFTALKDVTEEYAT